MIFQENYLEALKKIMNLAAFILVLELMFPYKVSAAVLAVQEQEPETMVAIGEMLIADTRFEPAEKANAQTQDGIQKDSIEKPEPADPTVVRQYRVTTTAYASVPEQTDSDPFTMADGSQVYDGAIAANFLSFKTKVRFPELFGDKVFEVHDRMNSRYNGKHIVDIWHADNNDAKKFGAKYNVLMEVIE